MYEKELPIEDRVTFENVYQDSEYDSGSDEEETQRDLSMRSTFYQDQFVLALA